MHTSRQPLVVWIVVVALGALALLAFFLLARSAPDSRRVYVRARAGAHLRLGEFAVTIPPGALSRSTSVTVRRLSPPQANGASSGTGGVVLGEAYDVTSSDNVSFLKPIRLSMLCPELRADLRLRDRLSRALSIGYFDGKRWVPVGPSTSDGRQVSASVKHLTPFAILVAPAAMMAVLAELPDLVALDDTVFERIEDGSFTIGNLTLQAPVYLKTTRYVREADLMRILRRLVGVKEAVGLSNIVRNRTLQVRIPNTGGRWNDCLSIGKIILFGDGKLKRVFADANSIYTRLPGSRSREIVPSSSNKSYLFRGKPLTTDDVLAGLLAHEAAHSTSGHWNETLKHNLFNPRITGNLWELFTSLVSTALTTKGNPAALLTVMVMSNELQPVPWVERQADTMALGWMVDAGFNPNGLLFALERTTEHPDDAPMATRIAWVRTAIGRLREGAAESDSGTIESSTASQENPGEQSARETVDKWMKSWAERDFESVWDMLSDDSSVKEALSHSRFSGPEEIALAYEDFNFSGGFTWRIRGVRVDGDSAQVRVSERLPAQLSEEMAEVTTKGPIDAAEVVRLVKDGTKWMISESDGFFSMEDAAANARNR